MELMDDMVFSHSLLLVNSDIALVSFPNTSLSSIFAERRNVSVNNREMDKRAIYSCSGIYHLHFTVLLKSNVALLKSRMVHAPVDLVFNPAVLASFLEYSPIFSAAPMILPATLPTPPTTGIPETAPVTSLRTPATSPKPCLPNSHEAVTPNVTPAVSSGSKNP